MIISKDDYYAWQDSHECLDVLTKIAAEFGLMKGGETIFDVLQEAIREKAALLAAKGNA